MILLLFCTAVYCSYVVVGGLLLFVLILGLGIVGPTGRRRIVRVRRESIAKTSLFIGTTVEVN